MQGRLSTCLRLFFRFDHHHLLLFSDAHNIERWYTQKVQSEPECENGMAELAEINMALNKLGFPGSWGDEQTSIATTKSKCDVEYK